VVDVRASDANLEPVVAQVRALLQRLAQGAMTMADLSRSAASLEKWRREASLDPRRRLLDLWRDPPEAPAPVIEPGGALLEAWRSWAATSLQDDKLVIVLARPKR
jgi:hypothetical protein